MCVCVVRWRACVCVWVCDKVSDDVMNKDERDEREREREFGGSGFCAQIRMRPSQMLARSASDPQMQSSFHRC